MQHQVLLCMPGILSQYSQHCWLIKWHWLRVWHEVCAGAGLVVHRQGPGIFLQGLDTYSSSGLRLPSNPSLPAGF